MKDKDFQQLADHEFAQLTWTDQQRLDTLCKMQKTQRPVMKRNFTVMLAAALLLLAITGTAMATGLSIPTLREFFTRNAIYLPAFGYTPPTFDETSVVTPTGYRHTSNLVDVAVDQVYLTDEALYFTIHFSAKNPDTLLFDVFHNSILLDGEQKRYWDLWDRKDLTLLRVSAVTMDDLDGAAPLGHLDSIDSYRDPETGAATLMFAYKHHEDLSSTDALSNSTLMLRFEVENLRNQTFEWNVLFIDLPAMKVVHAN